jgi:uncharacterized protein (DUF697 family)
MNDTLMTEIDSRRQTRHLDALSITHRYVLASAAAALVPVPGIDVTVMAGIHIALIKALTEHYGESFSDHAARNIVMAIGVTLLPGTLGSIASQRYLKLLPFGLGSLTQSAASAAASYALGRVIMAHFETGGTLDSFDVKNLHKLMWWRHEEKLIVAGA